MAETFINVDSLLDNNITPNEYVLAKLLFEGRFGAVNKLFRIAGDREKVKMLKTLINKGVITNIPKFVETDDPSTIVIIEEHMLLLLFSKGNNQFYELLNLYPAIVFAGKSKRTLRAKSVDALSNKKAKIAYDRIIKGDSRKHDYIVKCLKCELWERKKNDNVGYMVDFTKYIAEQAWDKYDAMVDAVRARHTEKAERKGYGDTEF